MDVANESVAPALRVRPTSSKGKKARVGVALAVIVAAVGFLLWKGLGDATAFYRNADEAVAQKQTLGTQRFRLQGTVVADTVSQFDGGLDFNVAFRGAEIKVHFVGTPGELFRPGIAVVLEGSWQGDRYEADNMLVKHSEQYREKNPDRVDKNGP